MSLGENIRRLRKQKGWTQTDLAERAGVRIAHISNMEQDQGDPKLSTLRKLLTALECTPNALLSEPEFVGSGTLLREVVIDRMRNLDERDIDPLVEVIDRYCIACETAAAFSQTRRIYSGETVKESRYQVTHEDDEAPQDWEHSNEG
jgi:transcriptional regulator with XRE-family HTH domain